jgi:Flp pilus assembly protein TadD
LKEKYGLSDNGLEMLFAELVKRGHATDADIARWKAMNSPRTGQTDQDMITIEDPALQDQSKVQEIDVPPKEPDVASFVPLLPGMNRARTIILIATAITLIPLALLFSSSYKPRLGLIGNLQEMEIMLREGEWVANSYVPLGGYMVGQVTIPTRYVLVLLLVITAAGFVNMLVGRKTGLYVSGKGKRNQPPSSRSAPPRMEKHESERIAPDRPLPRADKLTDDKREEKTAKEELPLPDHGSSAAFWWVFALLLVVVLIGLVVAWQEDASTVKPSRAATMGESRVKAQEQPAASKVVTPPDQWEAFLKEALDTLKDGNAKKAVETYSEYIRQHPRSWDAFNRRGTAYEHQGMLKEALADYNQAIGINPRHAEAFNNRGVVYRKQNNYTAALKDHQTAIELDSGFAEPYYNMGLVYEFQGNKPAAVQQFWNYLKANPAAPDKDEVLRKIAVLRLTN